MATTPSSGTLKGPDSAGIAGGEGEGLGDAFESRVEGAASELEGTPLGLEAVLANGVAELPANELPVPGVAVAVTAVGLAVGLGVAVGAGGGAVTTT